MSSDPVRMRRARAARLATAGKRIGYGCFALGCVAFVAAFVSDFPAALVTLVIVSLAVGSAALAPSIVVGYAVKAAEREDRERGL